MLPVMPRLEQPIINFELHPLPKLTRQMAFSFLLFRWAFEHNVQNRRDRKLNLTGIDWVIVGGESGPGARPMNTEWVREIRDQCLENGVAFFFKQWGGPRPKSGGRELDGRKWSQFPHTPASRAIAAE